MEDFSRLHTAVNSFEHQNFTPGLAKSPSSAFDYLIRNVPNPNILATDKKQLGHGKRIERPSAVCLDKSLFLRYNTKAIKFLIFDIDHITLQQFTKTHVLDLLRLPPTWVIATSRGVQLAYALRDPIPTRSMSLPTKKWLTAIKETIIKRFDADARASMRNYGVWRNPLNHDGTLNPDAEYSFAELSEAFAVPRVRQRKKVASLAAQKPVKGFVEGERNNALYWRCVQEINRFPDRYSEESLGDFAVAINAEQINPLAEAEAHKTGRSAWRQYHVYGKRLRYSPAFDYKKWKREYNAAYYRKQTGQETVLSKEDAARAAHSSLAATTKSKIEQAITQLESENRKITASAIARIAQVSRQTASKYLKRLSSASTSATSTHTSPTATTTTLLSPPSPAPRGKVILCLNQI